MSSIDRLNAVLDDGRQTLSHLGRVLAFINASKPEAPLLVLMINNVIVASASAVEETIRQLIVEYLTILEEHIGSHSRLPEKLRRSNYEKSAHDLKRMLSDEEVDAVQKLEDLRRCVTGERDYRLAKASLANNQGNFKSGQVSELAKQIGISSIWDSMLNDQAVADFVGLDVGPRCVEKFISDWNDTLVERDTVVHRLSQASGWGPDRIERAIEMFTIALMRLTTCLAVDADRLISDEALFLAR